MSTSLTVLLIGYAILTIYIAWVAATKHCKRYTGGEKVAVFFVFLILWVPILIGFDINRSLREFFKDEK